MQNLGSVTNPKDIPTKEYVDSGLGDVVLVQDTEPTSPHNKLWIQENQDGVVLYTKSETDTLLAGKLGIDAGISGASAGQAVVVKTVDGDGKPTSYETDTVKYTLTVTVTTQDGVTVTGQTVTVREGGAAGQVFGTASYNGQPVSFALPVGFSYHVSVSDTLTAHFNPTTANGIITNTNVSVTLTYSDFSSIKSFSDVKAALNADIDLTNLVGNQQITNVRNSATLTWDVVDYDSTNKEITLLLHATMPDQMVFEPGQALAFFDNGLPVGSYKFKNGSTYYYFTLTTAIPNGGQLRATTSTFQTYASQSATVTLETGAVSTTEISGSTDLGTCASDAGTYPLNHMDRVNYGSNNYKESGIFQWLNSDAAANTQMPRINKFSRPYSVNIPGFLNGWAQDDLDCIEDTVWKCSANSTYEAPAAAGGTTVKGNPYTVTAKIGLASEMEIFGSYGGVADGSSQFDLYVGSVNADRIKYYNNSARAWWLRSPYWNIAFYERLVGSSGAANNYNANSSLGCVPACKIKKSA